MWWIWVWVSSRRWWRTGKPGVLQSMGWQRVRHDWVTELHWRYSSRLNPFPPAFNLSQHQGLFKWVSSSHQVAKVLEFQLQHHSFQWTLGLISFRMYWLDLLAVQGTLKSLLQNHSSKASILQRSAFFIVQLSHPYMTSIKPALTRQPVTSLLFHVLSRLTIVFF